MIVKNYVKERQLLLRAINEQRLLQTLISEAEDSKEKSDKKLEAGCNVLFSYSIWRYWFIVVSGNLSDILSFKIFSLGIVSSIARWAPLGIRFWFRVNSGKRSYEAEWIRLRSGGSGRNIGTAHGLYPPPRPPNRANGGFRSEWERCESLSLERWGAGEVERSVLWSTSCCLIRLWKRDLNRVVGRLWRHRARWMNYIFLESSSYKRK